MRIVEVLKKRNCCRGPVTLSRAKGLNSPNAEILRCAQNDRNGFFNTPTFVSILSVLIICG